ncbi:hypothetical protein As57867_007298, partial [Aphanomyces stellatus]
MMAFHTRHPKNAVRALVEGIRPASLKAVVKSHMELDQKHLRNSVLQFMGYVKSKMVAQLEFTRASKSLGQPKVVADPPASDTSKRQRARQLKLEAKKTAAAKLAAEAQTKKRACWSCGGDHRIHDCTATSDADKKAIIAKKHEEWAAKDKTKPPANKSLRHPTGPPTDGSCWAQLSDSGIDEPIVALIDSGSDAAAIITQGLFDLVEQTGALDLTTKEVKTPQVMEGFGKVPLSLKMHVVLPELALLIGEATVRLSHVSAWVDPTDPGLGITIGRPIMKALGYSTEALLTDAGVLQDSFDLRELSVLDVEDSSAVCRALKARYAQLLAEAPLVEDFDDDEVVSPLGTSTLTVTEVLNAKVGEAQQKGLSLVGVDRLKAMLVQYKDVFRLEFKNDPPIAVEPLQVRFKPNAVPATCKAR